jgi:serine acetyltransferase
MELRPFSTGRECFFGNRSLLPPGTALPPKCLGGVLSVPPLEYVLDDPNDLEDLEDPQEALYGCGAMEAPLCPMTTRSSPWSSQRSSEPLLQPTLPSVQYMGNPPMRLRVANMESVPEPTMWQLVRHKCADVAVVFVPQLLRCVPHLAWLVVTFHVGLISEAVTGHLIFEDLSIFVCCVLVSVCSRVFFGFVIGNLARLVRGGRIVPSEHEYWAGFVDMWHICNKLMNVNVNSQLLVPFVGSRLLNHVLPLVSHAKVAPTALLVGAGAFREHDLVEIGEHSVVNECVVFRTHTFENWRLQFERVTIHRGVVVGCNTELMAGCRLESGCCVGINTIVYKAGVVPPDSIFAGLPGEVIGEVEPATTRR